MRIALWIIHVITVLWLMFACVLYMKSDPNGQASPTEVKVLNTIKEDNENSTSYYIVIQLSNGKIIEKQINRITYGATVVGDTGTMNLSKYDTGEADSYNIRKLSELLLLLFVFGYAVYGFIWLSNQRDKKEKRYY